MSQVAISCRGVPDELTGVPLPAEVVSESGEVKQILLVLHEGARTVIDVERSERHLVRAELPSGRWVAAIDTGGEVLLDLGKQGRATAPQGLTLEDTRLGTAVPSPLRRERLRLFSLQTSRDFHDLPEPSRLFENPAPEWRADSPPVVPGWLDLLGPNWERWAASFLTFELPSRPEGLSDLGPTFRGPSSISLAAHPGCHADSSMWEPLYVRLALPSTGPQRKEVLVVWPPTEGATTLRILPDPDGDADPATPSVLAVAECGDRAIDAFFAYVRRGALEPTRRAEAELTRRAIDSLQLKMSHPARACLAAYTLLRVGSAEHLDWTENLANWFGRIPDGAIVHGWRLIRKGRAEEAVAYFRKALRRGPPLYSEGLRLLNDGLCFLRDLYPHNRQVCEDSDRTHRLASAANLDSLLTCVLLDNDFTALQADARQTGDTDDLQPGYVEERFGSWQIGDDAQGGPVEFKLFFPDRAHDPAQYRPGRPTYGDPRIASIHVVGDFMPYLGRTAWDWGDGLALNRAWHPQGWVWSYRTPSSLAAGFYEYKFLVRFQDGTLRKVSDPCTRYGGRENENAAFVVGGSRPSDTPIPPVAGGRLPLRDLIVYELMIDDFTAEYRGPRAPLDAACDRLDYLCWLGVNAILFLPWTALPCEGFSRGPTPSQHFSVEHSYANAPNAPAEKLSWLRRLVAACHERGLHVLVDIDVNQVGDADAAAEDARGFPYRWLYQDQQDCPYVGRFGNNPVGLLGLDYGNACTQALVRDICRYWIDSFGIDGIRFANTTCFYAHGDDSGLPALLRQTRDHVRGDPKFSLTLEHLRLDAADVANRAGATSYLNDELSQRALGSLRGEPIDGRLLVALNSHAGLDADKVATIYLGCRGRPRVPWMVGARESAALRWRRTLPFAIALFTAPGTPMIHNGQEILEDGWLSEDGCGHPLRGDQRPLRWGFKDDGTGGALREIYARLIALRRRFGGLRSDTFYPPWEGWMERLNFEGYGLDAGRGFAIYHRWGVGVTGRVERFIVVLNFSQREQVIDVPFPDNGTWVDVLNGSTVIVLNYWLRGAEVGANWGHVYFQFGTPGR